jgi:hypothetical protein
VSPRILRGHQPLNKRKQRLDGLALLVPPLSSLTTIPHAVEASTQPFSGIRPSVESATSAADIHSARSTVYTSDRGKWTAQEQVMRLLQWLATLRPCRKLLLGAHITAITAPSTMSQSLHSLLDTISPSTSRALPFSKSSATIDSSETTSSQQ